MRPIFLTVENRTNPIAFRIAEESLLPLVFSTQLNFAVLSPTSRFSEPIFGFLISTAVARKRRKSCKFRCQSNAGQEEDYLLDAPVSVGDGFSFSGGKYSDESSPADDWFEQGKFVKAHPVRGSGGKTKDPIFGLTMGTGSQVTDDVFRWFCVESGSPDYPSVMLIHGFPSQAYSYRKVLPILSKDYHLIAFDWLGFGFSDKPQPRYDFDYTIEEYASSLESLIDELAINKVSLVVQGYFSPVVVKYAWNHQDKVDNLILVNPPLTNKHANLPSTLSIFSNILLGEIFSQDPLRASDKALTSCGPYKMKEDDAMVYRRPYLTSGSSGFALNAISRAMKKELKAEVEEMRRILIDENWKVQTTVCWGQRDRWLSYEGVEDFCKVSNHKLIEIPMAGHHVQEDRGDELGEIIADIISKRR
ncbi:hypothetical protein Nepgr_004265 [Nepenthes gracilis]|uniref:AB hydrolase-1 domain-containing protein n=1 Tax=Nepenthes gracilis TaxID=150966 RepID=A0AAD3S147_NEPGR|nr:hypothetical protein Nepgr_004265 [Nepenthes gracilis]